MERTETDTGFDGGAGELDCLRCGRSLRFDELGGFGASDNHRACFDCPACGARNEIVARPQPGLGRPPKAVVLRVIDRSAAPA
jgi:DNA-directed RNA polymerase subunit RPC12/RpoP